MPNEQALPVSVFQEVYIQDYRLDPTSYIDNVPEVFHIRGPLNMEALQQSIREILRRHTVLRTVYPSAVGYSQIILPLPNVDVLTLVDLRGTPFAVAWQPRVAEVEQQPFDLTQDLSLRCTLFQIADQEYIFSLVIHHIAFDAHSKKILLGELSTLYEDFVNKRVTQLPPLEYQYKDFAIWQRQYLAGETWLHQAKWWLTQVSGHRPLLKLPSDLPSPASKGVADQIIEQSIPDEFANGLNAFGRQNNVSLFALLLTALNVLLHDLTQEIDITVGFPVSVRNSTKQAKLIGLFAHDLTLRTDLSGNPTWIQVLQQTVHKLQLVIKHSNVPMHSLATLAPMGNFSRSSLFKVHTNMLNDFEQGLQLAGLTTQSRPLKLVDGPDLGVFFLNQGQKISWVYDSGQYSVALIETWAARYVSLLERMMDRPDAPLQKLLDRKN